MSLGGASAATDVTTPKVSARNASAGAAANSTEKQQKSIMSGCGWLSLRSRVASEGFN